ncbi:hypothetical protein [Flavobacterium sp. JP2137]|uniref:hypothetical protein n=1 Tax=Flavobacterium sp. JP2137 TaxID=3414510 RepID=UPI003D2FC1BB
MQEKSIIKQNILTYLRYKGVTPYKFYKDTGMTRGILTQNNGMSEENTLRFLDYYAEVNPEWLLTGKGVMLRQGVPSRESVLLESVEQALNLELQFLKESNGLLRDKIVLLEQNKVLLLREIVRLGGDTAVFSDCDSAVDIRG